MDASFCACVCILPTTIKNAATATIRPVLMLHIATMAKMKAMMRMIRPMIIRAATAWAQARTKHKQNKIVTLQKKQKSEKFSFLKGVFVRFSTLVYQQVLQQCMSYTPHKVQLPFPFLSKNKTKENL